MTPLRQRMLEDMQVRNLSPLTQRSYVEHVSRFARHFGRSPARLGPAEIRAYQLYLTQEKHLAPASIGIAVAALRFLYTITLQRAWAVQVVIPTPKVPDTLPVVLSPAEVVQFLASVSLPNHRTILTICYAAGLRISEAVRLTPPAIDSQRMVLRVEQGKGQKDRYVMLSPTLLAILRDWWRVSRPTHWLFPGDHHPGREPRLSGGPAALRDFQADHAAFDAARVCRPSPGSGHRRAHDPVTAGPPESGHHGALFAPHDNAGVRDREPTGPAPTAGPRGRPAPRAALSPGPWIARRSRWGTSSAAMATPIDTPPVAGCRRPSGAS
jgi:integrase